MADIIHQAKYPVQSVSKAIAILTYLSEVNRPNGAATLAEISAALDMGKSGVHRLLDTLMAHNYVERIENPVAYRLSWGVYRMASSVVHSHEISSADFSGVNDLCNLIGETVTVAVRNQNNTLVIYRALPSKSYRVNIETGTAEPIYATATGKAILSEMSDEAIDSIFAGSPPKLTPNTIVDAEQYKEVLRKVRINGYATEIEEYELGLTCVAYPIRNHAAKIVAAISATIPISKYSDSYLHFVAGKLLVVAQGLSRQLGYTEVLK